MPFEDLTEVARHIGPGNQGTPNIRKSIQDLHRTGMVILSTEKSVGNSLVPSSGWYGDYKFLDWTRSILRADRPDKTQLFKSPSEETTIGKIFAHVGDNPVIQKYIMERANQGNFLNSGQSELVLRLNAAGFLLTMAGEPMSDMDTSIEFRINRDGSCTIFEVVELPNQLRSLEDDGDIIYTKSRIGKVVLTSRVSVAEVEVEREGDVHEVQRQIQHEVIDFKFVPREITFCQRLLGTEPLSIFVNYVPQELRTAFARPDLSAEVEEESVADLRAEVVGGSGEAEPLLTQYTSGTLNPLQADGSDAEEIKAEQGNKKSIKPE